MKQYIDEYVSLCGQMCKSAEDYTNQNVKRHNHAMKDMLRLVDQLHKDTQLLLSVYNELLKHEDMFVKHCAAADCLRFGVHTDQAVKVLKMVCRKGDRMEAFAAKRSLKIWEGKLDPNDPF